MRGTLQCCARAGALMCLLAPYAYGQAQYQNEELPTEPPNFSSTAPGWIGGVLEAEHTGPLIPWDGGQVAGEIVSQVWRIEEDGQQRFGFTYRFVVEEGAMAYATLDPAGWSEISILALGAMGDGFSTPASVPSLPPPGWTTWADGDPYTIAISPRGAPKLHWVGHLGGTVLLPGQQSSLIWFETDASGWGMSVATVLSNGGGAAAHILGPVHAPEPATVVLLLAGATLMRRRAPRANA
jgi:hypothetical protein